MSIGKKHSTLGQSIDVRRTRLRVTIQATNPVVEVIDGDKEYIGLARGTEANGGRAT